MALAARDNQRVRASNENAPSHQIPTSKLPSGFSGYFLFFAGACFVAFGVALLQPPVAVPHAEWIATKFSRLGVQGLPIIAAGLTIFSLGFVARLQAKIGRSLAGQGEQPGNPDLERLAEEFGLLRGALGNVQTELLANKQRQDSMLESIQSVITQSQGGGENGTAMFRLAASLDQLGARIGERLKEQASTFDGRLTDITAAVVRAQQDITEAVDQAEQRASQHATTLAERPQVEAAESNQPDAYEFLDDLGYEEVVAEEHVAEAPPEEELQIMVELEPDPPAPVQDSPLGLLDSLDDFGSLVNPNPPLPAQPQPEAKNSWPPHPE